MTGENEDKGGNKMPEKPSGTRQYKCKECGKMLSSENELREHEKTHKGQSQQGAQGAGGQAGGKFSS
jgi:hypothetical protein